MPAKSILFFIFIICVYFVIYWFVMLTRRDFLKKAGICGCGLGLCSLAGQTFKAHAEIFEPAHEALWYERLSGSMVRCTLCPWMCTVPDGLRGKCGVRENRGGTYRTLVFENACAAHIDPIEKKPLFHFLPGAKAYSIAAPGCNMSCAFCQNWEISQARPDTLSTFALTADSVAENASSQGCAALAFTYTEPVVFYEYAAACAKAAKTKNIRSVIISNGYINPEPLKELCTYLAAVKIDFKALDEEYYSSVCGAALEPVLNTLLTLKSIGIWFEIVVLIVPTLNDSAEHAKKMCGWIVENLGPDVPIHFSRFHPTYKLSNLPPTPVSTVSMFRETALAAGSRYAYVGNVPGHAGEHTYCPSCRARVIERYGMAVINNRLLNGTCPECSTAVAGVWV